MKIDYSLQVLKLRKAELQEKKDSIEKGEGRWLVLSPQQETTKLLHQLKDLQFAIEVLETYQD